MYHRSCFPPSVYHFSGMSTNIFTLTRSAHLYIGVAIEKRITAIATKLTMFTIEL